MKPGPPPREKTNRTEKDETPEPAFLRSFLRVLPGKETPGAEVTFRAGMEPAIRIKYSFISENVFRGYP